MSNETKKPATKKNSAHAKWDNKHIMFVSSVMIDDESGMPIENFVGIPLTETSPFVEVIFDPKKQILGVVSKNKKESFHWVTRVDPDGLPVATKNRGLAASQPAQQQRVQIETYHEYYIRKQDAILEFLEAHAVNSFDFSKFIN